MRRDRPLDRAGEDLAHRLASSTTRRSFIGVIGAALLGLTADRATSAGRAPIPGTERVPGGWFGFCGHYWTTEGTRKKYEPPEELPRGEKPLPPL